MFDTFNAYTIFQGVHMKSCVGLLGGFANMAFLQKGCLQTLPGRVKDDCSVEEKKTSRHARCVLRRESLRGKKNEMCKKEIYILYMACFLETRKKKKSWPRSEHQFCFVVRSVNFEECWAFDVKVANFTGRSHGMWNCEWVVQSCCAKEVLIAFPALSMPVLLLAPMTIHMASFLMCFSMPHFLSARLASFFVMLT